MKQKRRPLRIINKKLQVKFALWISLSIAINTILITLISWFLIKNNYEKIIDSIGDLVPQLAYNLQMEQFSIGSILFFITTFSTILAFIIGLWLSGKIAGPLFAFTRAVNKLTSGIDEGFKLRENDELKDLEILYNDIQKLLKH